MSKWKSPERRTLLDNVDVGEGFYVYFLMDIDSVFYVGKGTKRRWNGHFHDSSLEKNSYKNNKIKLILNQGRKVNVKIVAKNLSETEALILESFLIEEFGTYRNQGSLCNIYTGDFRKSTESYQFDEERRKAHKLHCRGINSTATEEDVHKAKLLVHYHGMSYEEVANLPEFSHVTKKQVKTWCNRQTFGYVAPHLKSISEITEEKMEECYNLWKKGFLQREVSDILGIEYWQVKRYIQKYKKCLHKEQ